MAHTFDTKSKIAASISNPVTGVYTCGAGATLLVITLIYANGIRTGAPTFNSVALIQAGDVQYPVTSPEARAELWYMLAPPTESEYAISVPNPNTLSLEVCISSYKAQSGYVSALDCFAGTKISGAGDPTLVILTHGDGSVIVSCAACNSDDWNPANRSGTQLYDTDNGTWGGGHQYYLQSSAGSHTTYWWNNNGNYGVCAAAFGEIQDGHGISVSKANIYEVLEPPLGISVSKANIYEILEPPKGIAVSKALIYAVLGSSGGVLVNPNLQGGFRSNAGGYNI